MIEIKACELFKSEDNANYCITAIMINAGRKAQVLEEFGFGALGITKKKLINLLKYLFAAVPLMPTSGNVTSMIQTYV